MNTAKSLLLLCATFLITSCGFKDAEPKATNTLKNLLEERISTGGLFPNEAYKQSFWKDRPQEEWAKFASYMDASHGGLESYEIVNIDAKGRKKGLSPAGWVGFQLKTKYKKGIEGKEMVSFYRDGKDMPFEIMVHVISTPPLDEMAKKSQGQ